MGLSNTATPKYYGEFRAKVLRGEILVCHEISLEMNRIDELIRNPTYYYDESAVEGYIAFCEQELTLVDGSDLILPYTFKLWAEEIFGWYYFIERKVYVSRSNGRGGYVMKRIKKRLVNKQYLIVSRSNAKTLYSGTVQSYELVVDQSTTKQIAVAPIMKQAEEILSPIATAISRARGPLFKFLTEGSLQNTTGSKRNRQKLTPTKKGIENFLTNSIIEIRPMTIPKLQGLRVKCSSVDEWLSCPIREDVIGAIEQGANKVKDWIIIATSSEGTIRNGAGDDIKVELSKILRGEYYNPHVSIFWYKQDDIREINDPSTWIKSNPNIGVTVDWETIQLDVERAENSPSNRNDIIAKRFGIPQEGYTYFFTYEETVPHRKQDYRGMPCGMGIDLSQGNDFCAFTFLFPLGRDYYGIKARSYIASLTLRNLPPTLRRRYDEFIEEGSLIVQEDKNVIDLELVYDDLDRHIIDNDYDVRCIGYDPYNAKNFVERWEKENGPYGIEKVIQGSKTESVPLGELKTLAEHRFLLFDELIMKFCMGNAIVIKDTNGNRKLLKQKYEQKIDNVSAMMDAYISIKANPDAFE